MTSFQARKPSDIGAVIRVAREDAGVTQAELAQRLAFSRDYMIDLESGRPNLYLKRLFRVFHALGVTVTLEFGDQDAGS